MKTRHTVCRAGLVAWLMIATTFSYAQRQEIYLRDGWKFAHTDAPEQASVSFDDSKWETVTVPHDWAIAGPFDKDIDKQTVAITQNGEKQATEKTGRSGSLPWVGTGWYRTYFRVTQGTERALLNFDGAMSEPVVYVNGQQAGEWKYGYSAFNVDITPYIYKDGRENVLAVRLQNLPESSRWYPGAGLYRPVKLVTTGRQAIAEWGINIRTISLDNDAHQAGIQMDVATTGGKIVRGCGLLYRIMDGTTEIASGRLETQDDSIFSVAATLNDIVAWTPETPQLYTLHVQLVADGGSGGILDEKSVRFGIRTVQVDDENGFRLNGVSRKLKGVCLHHDLGMIGTAVNKAALAHQLVLLKGMGCDAIRTSHNMPSQLQMELCDSLGLMVMAESFDAWQAPKVKNGYNRFYQEWVERDLTNLVLANRLHPSIVMWSIGNEISEQGSSNGAALTRQMQNIIHRLDDTRPVTAGMNHIDNAIQSGYAQVLDVPGINYRLPRYEAAFERLRQGFVLGSETASTVSSRGVYKFPVVPRKSYAYADGQCSGYDVEACSWSNLPDEDWVRQDDCPWVIGEFVWTGFDYLGEPTPYDTYWPSRSSYFGIFDLAGLPKDRYYLYRSHWNRQVHTVHLLPHWTWPGREGQVTPVYCYTDWPSAELFVNGVSQGRISKNDTCTARNVSPQDDRLLDRYRLRWNHVKYEPGELRVVVYDRQGNRQGEQIVRTAGVPHHLVLEADRTTLRADGEDMAFITVRVVDKDGNLCPDADNRLSVSVSGAGAFKGICNGDATSTEVFTEPTMKAFKGMLSVGVMTTTSAGRIRVRVSGKGIKTTQLTLQSR